MKKLVFLLIFLLTFNLVEAGVREDAEKYKDRIEVPEEINRALPFAIHVLVTDTGENFTLEITDEGRYIVESYDYDVEIRAEEEVFRGLTNSTDMVDLFKDVEVKSDSFKGHVFLNVVENALEVELVEEPSLWYRIIGFFVKMFIK